ncbi:sensor histidine kinase, putative [alpha proteobacterium BAL199]|nr:sensor histidine kinase, putative [alpha proteobacterium BAL199]
MFADERFARLYNVDPETARTGAPVELFLNSVHPDDSQRLNKAIQKALMDGGDLAEEYRLIQADGTARWVLARGHCFHDDHNQPLRFPGAVIDITERKEAEEHRKLLVNELNHRVKNMLASVQAIANQTLRNGVSIAEGRAVFGDRLIALSRAQDVLIGELGAGAEIASVIKTAIEPLAGDAERLRIDGPGVQLSPRAALSLSMAVHELCTNAAKYGALSKPEGHVDVRWSLDMGEDGERHLSLRWTETGGPTVSPPQRKGFGSRLIEHALATELNGAVSLDYARAGLVCTIEAPLKAVIGDLPLDG